MAPPREENSARRQYLAEVSHLYYNKGKTQQEIAEIVGVTRSGVSRLLTEAREKGVVEIVVHYPWQTSRELEDRLSGLFGLKDVRVLVRGGKSDQEMLEGLGSVAARYFLNCLSDGDIVGISWGTALHSMLQAIRPTWRPAAKVVQLIGGTGAEHSSKVGPLLAPMLANLLGCTCHYLHAPLITESEEFCRAVMRERPIRETLDLGRRADIALVGIGSTHPDIYNPFRLGYVSREELEELTRAGAVGLVCGRHYSIDGTELDIPVNRRVVGLSLRELAEVGRVIGIAGGSLKAESILGALRGGHVNVLITDDVAARRALELC